MIYSFARFGPAQSVHQDSTKPSTAAWRSRAAKREPRGKGSFAHCRNGSKGARGLSHSLRAISEERRKLRARPRAALRFTLFRSGERMEMAVATLIILRLV